MLLKLVVYVDEERHPLELGGDACIRAYNMQDLAVYLRRVLQRPPRVILYWSMLRKRYELLTSLQLLVQQHHSDDGGHNVDSNTAVLAHLWVETRSLQLEPVDPDRDAEEYRELSKHVWRWAGNAYIMFSLQNALRVTDPSKERLFDDVRHTRLQGDGDRVELLFYTNNSLSASDVLQRGFDRGGGGGRGEDGWMTTPVGPSSSTVAPGTQLPPFFVFSSSMSNQNDKNVFSTKPHKVLLCEVALGLTWLSNASFSTNVEGPPPGYDSVSYREKGNTADGVVKSVRIGKNFQALPRYVLTMIAKKRDRRLDARPAMTHMHPASSSSVVLVPAAAAAGDSNRNSQARSPSNMLFGALKKNTSFAQSSLGRSRSAPPRVSRKNPGVSPASQPPSPTCGVHNGTLMGLWCLTCGHVICPYCASVGEHKGHEVTKVEGMAGEMRNKMRDLRHELSVQLDNYKRLQSQLRSQQTELRDKSKEAASAVERSFSSLHRLIDAKKREWLERLEEQTHCVDEPIKDVERVVREYMETIMSLEDSWGRVDEESTPYADGEESTPAAVMTVAYMMDAPKLLENGVRLMSQCHERELTLTRNASNQLRAHEAALFHVDCSSARESIERLLPERTTSFSRQSSTPMMITTNSVENNAAHSVVSQKEVRSNGTSERRDAAVACSASPLSSLLKRSDGLIDEAVYDDLSENISNSTRKHLLMRRLSDVRNGYIWCVHDVSKYFHPEQRRAVCSGTFRLMGVEWDLRIQAPDAKGITGSSGGANNDNNNAERNPPSVPSGEDEPLGLFLFPVGHTLRLDFRVSIFSAVLWAEWKVSGWTASFAGKGWGVYPLLPRHELMQTDRLAWENTLKICLTPTSGIY